MAFTKDTLILVDYTARVKDGDVFDTTSSEEAKKHSIHDPAAAYGPELVSIGSPSFPVLPGFGEALAAAAVGEKITAEFGPEKGFGERSRDKIRMIPLRKLGEDAEKVSIGDHIDLDGKKGTIRFIGSGRVQIDYNHRFAGKTLVYEATITRALESDDDKAAEILKRRMRTADGGPEFKRDGPTIEVAVPPKMYRAEDLLTAKNLAQADIFKFLPSIETLKFVEEYKNRAAKAPPPAEKPAAAQASA